MNTGKDHRTAISLMTDNPIQVITATGVGRHAADRVPMMILRRQAAKEMSLVWCVSLDGRPIQIRLLPVRDSDGNSVSSATATAIQIEAAEEKRTLVVNPDGLSLSIELPDGSKRSVAGMFAVE